MNRQHMAECFLRPACCSYLSFTRRAARCSSCRHAEPVCVSITWPRHGPKVGAPHVRVQPPSPCLLQARGSSNQRFVRGMRVLHNIHDVSAACRAVEIRRVRRGVCAGIPLSDTLTNSPANKQQLPASNPPAGREWRTPAQSLTCRHPVACEYSMSACAWRSSRVCTRPSSGLLLPCITAASSDSMLTAGRPKRSAKPAHSTKGSEARAAADAREWVALLLDCLNRGAGCLMASGCQRHPHATLPHWGSRRCASRCVSKQETPAPPNATEGPRTCQEAPCLNQSRTKLAIKFRREGRLQPQYTQHVTQHIQC